MVQKSLDLNYNPYSKLGANKINLFFVIFRQLSLRFSFASPGLLRDFEIMKHAIALRD